MQGGGSRRVLDSGQSPFPSRQSRGSKNSGLHVFASSHILEVRFRTSHNKYTVTKSMDVLFLPLLLPSPFACQIKN